MNSSCPVLQQLQTYVGKYPSKINYPNTDTYMYRLVTHSYGTWDKALASIGIKPTIERRVTWTRDSVLKALDSLVDLSCLTINHPGLYQAMLRNIGNLEHTVQFTKNHKDFTKNYTRYKTRKGEKMDPDSYCTLIKHKAVYKDSKGYFARKGNRVISFVDQKCTKCNKIILSHTGLSTNICCEEKEIKMVKDMQRWSDILIDPADYGYTTIIKKVYLHNDIFYTRYGKDESIKRLVPITCVLCKKKALITTTTVHSTGTHCGSCYKHTKPYSKNKGKRSCKWTKDKVLETIKKHSEDINARPTYSSMYKAKLGYVYKMASIKFLGSWTNAVNTALSDSTVSVKPKNDEVKYIDNKVKYIDEKEERHQIFFNLFNDMISKGGMKRKLNGAILSLPSEYPWADKGRIDHFFHDPTEYLWYENQPGKLRSVKYVAKQLNKIMVNTIAYRVYSSDIIKSRHTNVGLANLDLECTMNSGLMEDVYEIIKSGLTGRKNIGLILNTYGRGPKNMTLDKRDSLWNNLLNRLINDGHSINYTSGRLTYTSGAGSTMFLFGAVIAQ